MNLTNKNRCTRASYYTLETVEQQVFAKILEFSTEAKLAQLRDDLAKKNKKAQQEIVVLTAELKTSESKLAAITAKKEKYLDSLISRDFKTAERQHINEKINDFTLQEKQLSAAIYRQQFELSNKAEAIVSIEPFKEALVYLKLNFETMGSTDKVAWLNKNIERISYTKEAIAIEFKTLKLGS